MSRSQGTSYCGSSTSSALLINQACQRHSSVSNTKQGSVSYNLLPSHAQEVSAACSPHPLMSWLSLGDPPQGFPPPQPRQSPVWALPPHAEGISPGVGKDLLPHVCSSSPCCSSERSNPGVSSAGFLLALTLSQWQGKLHHSLVPPIA